MSYSRDIQDIFNEAAERLTRGESLEQVLALYPQDADLLRPLLETVETTRRTRIPQAEIDAARDRVRFQVSRALEQPIPPQPKLMPRRLPPLAVAGVVLILTAVVALTLIDREQQATIEQLTQTAMPTATETPTATLTPSATPTLTVTASPTLSATTTTPAPTDEDEDDDDDTTPSVTLTRQAPVIGVTPAATQSMTTSPTRTPGLTRTPRPTVTEEDNDVIVTSCGVVVPDEWEDYRLRSGDTLSGLAAATGTTVDELMRVNCITNPRGLLVGDLLYLPDDPSDDNDNGGGGDDDGDDGGDNRGGDDSGGGNDDNDDDDDDNGDDDGDDDSDDD